MCCMKKYLLVFNWKSYVASKKQTHQLLSIIKKYNTSVLVIDKTVVLPSAWHLSDVFMECKKMKKVFVGAQTTSLYAQGPYTGELSARGAHDCGARFALVGHSERRLFFGETDDVVNGKIKEALACKLTPIVCVGERARCSTKQATAFVLRQLTHATRGIDMARIVIAYEPVWAIGGDKTINDAHIAQVMEEISAHCAKKNKSQKQTILYGGSVSSKTIEQLFSHDYCDGFLIGSTSANTTSLTALYSLLKKN